MEKKKMGIVGYGGMGRAHAERFIAKDLFDIAGICDVDETRQAVAKEDGLFVYKDYEAMLADPALELILVATPNNFHRDYSIMAMEKGKSVISEKPVAMSSEELADIIAVRNKTGKIFTVHQNRRMDMDFQMVRKTVMEDGLLGKPFCFESRVQGARGIPEGWRQYQVAGGGMMLDWGVHLIDQLLYMIPEKVTKVYCKMYHVQYEECDDCFKLFLTFESGLTAQVEVGTCNFMTLPRWYVTGDRGALLIKDWDQCKIIHSKDTQIAWERDIVYTKAGPTRTMAPRPKHTVEELDITWPTPDYTETYRALYRAIDGKGKPLVDPAEAMRVMKVMEASFESDRTAQVLSVEI